MKIYKLNSCKPDFVKKIYFLTGKSKMFLVEDVHSVYILCEHNTVVFLINYTYACGVLNPSTKYLLDLILNSKEMVRADYRKPCLKSPGKYSKYGFIGSKHSIEYLSSIVEDICWFDFKTKSILKNISYTNDLQVI